MRKEEEEERFFISFLELPPAISSKFGHTHTHSAFLASLFAYEVSPESPFYTLTINPF